MNYTENYHLPQWDESDRILRKDFNQMCASIEGGLTGSRDRNGAAHAKTWDRLCRLAYNHYCAVQKMEPAPWQIGLFQQDPAKDQEGIGGTPTYWEGVRFAGKTETPLTNEILTNCLHTVTEMTVYKNQLNQSTAMTAIFQPPASGTLRNFALQGRYSDCTLRDTFQFRITLTNQDTGAVEKTLNMQLTYNTNGATFTQYFNGSSIPFIGGVRYLITMEPLSATSNMTAAFVIAPDTAVTTIANDGVITAEHTFDEQECGTGGMMVLRYAAYGAGGTVSFQWDGVDRVPDIVRNTRTEDGRSIVEAIYLRDDVVPMDSTLSLRFESAVGGSFLFYDWGAMLF